MYTQTHKCKGTARNWLRLHKSLVMQSITRIFTPQVCVTSLCQCTTSVVLLKWQQINASKKVACLEKKNICYLYSDRWIIRFFWWHTDTRFSFVFHYTEKSVFLFLFFYFTALQIVQSVFLRTLLTNQPKTKIWSTGSRCSQKALMTCSHLPTKQSISNHINTQLQRSLNIFIMTNGINHHFSLQPCMEFQCTCANAITKLAFSTEKWL